LHYFQLHKLFGDPPYIKFDWWEILKNGDCREEVLVSKSTQNLWWEWLGGHCNDGYIFYN